MGRKNVISFVGFSKSGKTNLISELVRYLSRKGYKIGVIKHTTKNFQIDKEGKDSWRIYHSGADVVVLSPVKMAYQIHLGDLGETRRELPLNTLTGFFSEYDLVITEGFKKEFSKGVLVARNLEELTKLLDFLREGIQENKSRREILAAVVGESGDFDLGIRFFQPDQIEELAEFILSSLDG